MKKDIYEFSGDKLSTFRWQAVIRPRKYEGPRSPDKSAKGDYVNRLARVPRRRDLKKDFGKPSGSGHGWPKVVAVEEAL